MPKHSLHKALSCKESFEVTGSGHWRCGQKPALCIYRIGQEAMHNAVKYADASRIEIELKKQGKNLILKVRDDGRGFRVSEQESVSGLGLSSMRERAHLLNAALRVDSAPGQGVTVSMSLPLEETKV